MNKNTNTTEYRITGMTCGGCEISVRDKVRRIAEVEDVRVSAQTGNLSVDFSGDFDDIDERVLAAVAEAGYSAVRRF